MSLKSWLTLKVCDVRARWLERIAGWLYVLEILGKINFQAPETRDPRPETRRPKPQASCYSISCYRLPVSQKLYAVTTEYGEI